MTTADYALIDSIFSAVASIAGLVWNVWSKFVFPKPRVGVSFAMMMTAEQRLRIPELAARLRASDHGAPCLCVIAESSGPVRAGDQ